MADDELLKATLQRREALRGAMGDLEAATAEPSSGRASAWHAHVTEAVTSLQTVFAEHVRATEADDGLFVDVLEEEPRLARMVERLRQEHVDTARAIEELAAIATPSDEAGVQTVRDAAVDILGRLVRHRHLGAELVHEAFTVDTSVGD